MRKILSRTGLAVLSSLLIVSSAHAARYNVRFVLIHQPSKSAEQAARDFATRVEKDTKGDVHVQVLTRDDYAAKFNGDRPLSAVGAMRATMDGRLEMAQTYTNILGQRDRKLWVLGMPYLFKDYDHAERVIEGPIGKELIASLEKTSPLKGLALTYSGGFGMLATTNVEARSPEQLKGLRMQISSGASPIGAAVGRALDVDTLVTPPEAFVTLAKNNFIDGVETTFALFHDLGDQQAAHVAIDTQHYLLTTMLVMNKSFFESLPPQDQAVIARDAVEIARSERQLTIKANATARAELQKEGVKVIDLTAAEKQAYAEALQPVYRLSALVGPDLIKRIRDAAADTRTAQR